jgi:hypothetical protein
MHRIYFLILVALLGLCASEVPGLELSSAAARRLRAAFTPRNTRGTPPPTVVPNTTAPLVVVGDLGSMEGIFDPSADCSGRFLAYSSVPAANSIRTRIAVRVNGTSWRYATEVNLPFKATLRCAAGACPGVVVHEVSSLIEDISDADPSRRFKLFTHTYLVGADGVLHYDMGHIHLWWAPTADAPGRGWAGPCWAGRASPALKCRFRSADTCAQINDDAAAEHHPGIGRLRGLH